MNPRPPSTPAAVALLPGVLRFGGCEVHVATREILFCRQSSPISPKAFDVLLYLIEHRERVVSKNELLDAIWRTTYVSESVVARMVMKIRRVIGDTGEVPQLIRTVHRIGYRFIGSLDVVASEPAAPPWVVSERNAGRPRLALTPFRNATGIAELSWVELGMMTLLENALMADGVLEALPVRDSMLAFGALQDGLSSADVGLAVRRATAADYCLGVTVSGLVGRFRVEWSLYRAGGECVSANLTGRHLPSLAIELARRLNQWVTGEGARSS